MLVSHPTKFALEELIPEAWVVGGKYNEEILTKVFGHEYFVMSELADLHEELKRFILEELLEISGVGTKKHLSKDSQGRRIWPKGFVGSLTDKRSVILAAIAEQSKVGAMGIDLELEEDEGEMLNYTVSNRERPPGISDKMSMLAGFSAKEAAFKAYQQLDNTVIDFDDIRLDWIDNVSRISEGIAHCPSNTTFTIQCTTVDRWVVSAASAEGMR